MLRLVSLLFSLAALLSAAAPAPGDGGLYMLRYHEDGDLQVFYRSDPAIVAYMIDGAEWSLEKGAQGTVLLKNERHGCSAYKQFDDELQGDVLMCGDGSQATEFVLELVTDGKYVIKYVDQGQNLTLHSRGNNETAVFEPEDGERSSFFVLEKTSD